MLDVRVRRKVQDREPSESPAQGLITRQAGDCFKVCVSGVVLAVRDLESWAGKDHFVTTNSVSDITPSQSPIGWRNGRDSN